jgi:hypothetical protein
MVQILLAALLATGLATGEARPCGAELFRVTRNTNTNVVLYEARFSAPGVLDARDPVHPVWIMLAEDGRREELNLVESALAYGVDVHRDEAGDALVVSIRARPELAIRVALESGCPVARTRIDGRDATLRLVHVEASGGLFPEVVQVSLVGVERTGGTEVRERLLASE